MLARPKSAGENNRVAPPPCFESLFCTSETMSQHQDKAMQHQESERQEVQPRQGLWQPLIVPCQAPGASCPSEVALDDPTA